jgi:hypothetical protein
VQESASSLDARRAEVTQAAGTDFLQVRGNGPGSRYEVSIARELEPEAIDSCRTVHPAQGLPADLRFESPWLTVRNQPWPLGHVGR